MSLANHHAFIGFEEDSEGFAAMPRQIEDAYDRFASQCLGNGELNALTKQLIALCVSLYANNENSMQYHVQEALAHGASDSQIMEAVAVVAATAGGHALSQGVMQVGNAIHAALSDSSIVHAIEPDRLRSGSSSRISRGGMQDYLQDTEFSADPGWEGMAIPGSSAISPSY
ncbi:carboxymuconolactone decarboxylase family protein [Cohnella panacarvi]|uniref:carboxymuconolactone decarboxylase family protein n=1 Tax=Cohnella panacarvi TaxID=400776 RepID=UPI00047A3BB8|nr:carboxymuconolactone decarboxylase family protein [Cohnella panacarvi]